MSDIRDDQADSSVATIDQAKFRQVLGHFPTGVTVITAMHEGAPAGFAVGSFASLSLDPPQVLFCAGKQSSSWPKIQAAGKLCVNVLADDQEDVSRVFASKAPDKFAELAWRPSGNGAPFLEGSLVSIDCEVANVIDSGDHFVVIASVTHLDVHHEGHPLIFYRGGYARVSL